MNRSRQLAFLAYFAAFLASCKKEEAKPAVPVSAPATVAAPVEKKPGIESSLPQIAGPDSPEVSGSKLPVLVYCYTAGSAQDLRFTKRMEAVREKFKGKVEVFRVDAVEAAAAGKLPRGIKKTPYIFFGKKDGRKGAVVSRQDGMEPSVELWLAGRPLDEVLAGLGPKKAPPEEPLKEIVDPASPEVVNCKLPVVLYYYASWSAHDRMLMGVVEEIAKDYKGKARFFRINVTAAEKAKTLPAEVVAMPYMVFMRPGKERQTKLARPGEARKELEFFISEWLSDD